MYVCPIFIVCLAVCCACDASAAAATPRQGQVVYSRVECRRDKEVRVLEIDSTDQESCRLQYLVGKKRRHVAGATSGRSVCLQERDRIRSDLVAEHFVCDEPVDPYLAKE